MPEAKPKFLNFPDREPKVILGEHINATTARALTRMTIGTFEMSVAQIEAAKLSTAAAKSAINAWAKEHGQVVEAVKSRDHVALFHAKGESTAITIWVTTPLEPTQSAHLVWVRVVTIGAEPTIGIAYKLTNEYTPDIITTIARNAVKNARHLPPGEHYVLKGNPPPRFAKKKAEAAVPATEPAVTAEAADVASAAAAPADTPV